jgi:hypothetical protein
MHDQQHFRENLISQNLLLLLAVRNFTDKFQNQHPCTDMRKE